MRPLFGIALALAIAVSSSVGAQTSSSQGAPPQTARQALIEMLFGEAPGHLEKHLPDLTRQTLEKLGGTNGQSVPGVFSMLAAQAKNRREKLETFDSGSTFLTVEEPAGGGFEKMVITVEQDDLAGGEDNIELALHVFKDGKEETLVPQILRFTFSMKMESEVWRLNEVRATARFPIADPAFLKAVEEHQLHQNEEMARWSVRSVVNAERLYQSAHGGFACTLSALGSAGNGTGAKKRVYLYDSQLASGKKNGYAFAISDCDTSHYRIAAGPVVPDSGQRAFCSDESGTLRSSADGKPTTCLASGEVVEEKIPAAGTHVIGTAPQGNAASGTSELVGRVRVSQGVSTGFLIAKVAPTYPAEARSARIQGTVVMQAVINKTGDVESLELVSGHPLLAPAALEAVKQWKYRPYLLNGKAVTVETQITVNFALSQQQ